MKLCPLFHWLLGSSSLNDAFPIFVNILRNVCQPFPELTSCLASFYFTFILIYPAIILSCYIFHKLLFFLKWIINKPAYLRYTLWNCLKLVCPLDFIVFSLNVLALLLRNKWKHMCKTNHSLSFQICHELPDQREMRKATLQTGPQGSLNQASLSGAGKDRFPLVWSGSPRRLPDPSPLPSSSRRENIHTSL